MLATLPERVSREHLIEKVAAGRGLQWLCMSLDCTEAGMRHLMEIHGIDMKWIEVANQHRAERLYAEFAKGRAETPDKKKELAAELGLLGPDRLNYHYRRWQDLGRPDPTPVSESEVMAMIEAAAAQPTAPVPPPAVERVPSDPSLCHRCIKRDVCPVTDYYQEPIRPSDEDMPEKIRGGKVTFGPRPVIGCSFFAPG